MAQILKPEASSGGVGNFRAPGTALSLRFRKGSRALLNRIGFRVWAFGFTLRVQGLGSLRLKGHSIKGFWAILSLGNSNGLH